MAWSYGTGVATGNDAAATTIVLPTFAFTAGGCVLLGVSNYGDPTARTVSTSTPPSDSAGNTYSRMGAVYDGGGDAYWRQEIWIGTGGSSHASNQITVTFTGSTAFRTAAAVPVYGQAASPIDTGYEINAIDVSSPYSAGTDSTADANELLVEYCTEAAAAGCSFSNGTGTVHAQYTSATVDNCIATREVGAAGNNSIDVAGTASRTICCVARAIKMAAAASAVPKIMLLQDHFSGGIH